MILRTNRDRSLIYNYIIPAAIFRVENDTFAEQLQIVIREDQTTQTILKEMSQGDIKEFTKEDEFLLF